MLSSRQILDLVSKPSSLNRGAAQFLTSTSSRGPLPHTPKQRAFLADMAGTPTPDLQPAYTHPESNPDGLSRGDGPLSPVELAWLQRLPQDPEQVTYDHARALAGLARSVPKMKHPADARLVNDIWQPVKEVHDRNAAAVVEANASQPLPPLPSSTLGALADAVAHEQPVLTDSEAIGRANDMLSDARGKRNAARQTALDAAHETTMQIDGRHYSRTVTAL